MENEPIKTIQVSNEINLLCNKTMAIVEMDEYLRLLNSEKEYLKNVNLIQYRKDILEIIKLNIDTEKSMEYLKGVFEKYGISMAKENWQKAFIQTIEYTGKN
jgi:hypothetical protein